MRKRLLLWFLCCPLTVLATLPCLSSTQEESAPLYIRSDIDSSEPVAAIRRIINHDHILGLTYKGSYQRHAFLWGKAGYSEPLETPDGAQSEPSAANHRGEIVGILTLPNAHSDAIVWKNSRATVLPGLPGGPNRAYGINDHGEIVGESAGRAVLWCRQKLHELGSCPAINITLQYTAIAINNHGQIVGTAHQPEGMCPTGVDRSKLPKPHAWIWERGHMPDLGEGQVLAINDRGQVLIKENFTGRIWQKGQVTPLRGTPDFASFLPYGINESGEVLGACIPSNPSQPGHWAIWKEGQVTDLTAFIIPGPYTICWAIDDQGEIVGTTHSDKDSIFLLSPTRPKRH